MASELALQLSLPVSLPDEETFESFNSIGNEFVVSYLQQFCHQHNEGQKPLSYVFGPPGLGKSHLLFASCHQAKLAGVESIYLNMLELKNMPCELINEVAEYGLICIDNLHAIIGSKEWEIAIFDLINQVLEKPHQPKLIMAATISPIAAQFNLPDLVSRLTWGAVFQLATRTDEELCSIIQFRLELRGLETTDESIRFLLTRVERNLANLMQIVNELDKKSLQAQRKLTIPFIKQALNL